jgi:hypothetical protein
MSRKGLHYAPARSTAQPNKMSPSVNIEPSTVTQTVRPLLPENLNLMTVITES